MIPPVMLAASDVPWRQDRRAGGRVELYISVWLTAGLRCVGSAGRQHVPRRLALGQRRDPEELGDRHAGLVVAAQLLRVVGHADRVGGEGGAMRRAGARSFMANPP